VTDDKPSSIPLPAQTAVVTNGVTAARAQADANIRAQFDIITKSEGALTLAGGIMARAAIDGVYPGTAQQIAEHCYGLRGPAGKSSDSQISKFSNFITVARAWERCGIELIEALVQRTEGTGNRYRIVQLVLVVLKKRLRAKAVMPSLEELAEMLADAQAPKTRKSAATEASTGELSDESTDASPGPSLSDHFVRGLDALLRDSNTPPDITAKCRDIKSYVEKTTAEFCSVSKTSERSGDDPLAIPDHLDRRATRPLRAGSLKGDVT
jgi:hypothetical protein